MIETARLRLRRGTDADTPDLVAALNDWNVAQWLQRPPFPYSAHDARAFLRWSGAHERSAPPVAWVLADRASDRLLGVASLEPRGESAELGYWLTPAAQGRGLMREAVAALLEHGADGLPGARTAYATTDPDNHRSQAVLLALGFRKVAEEAREEPTRRGGSVLFRFERALRVPAVERR
jgi:RimJ/RimL family protein N-acetyltransferase